jgi:hypothetical protein
MYGAVQIILNVVKIKYLCGVRALFGKLMQEKKYT